MIYLVWHWKVAFTFVWNSAYLIFHWQCHAIRSPHDRKCDIINRLIVLFALNIIILFIYPALFEGLKWINTLRPRQDGLHFPDDIFKRIFLNENVWILLKISLKLVPKGPINNIPALVQIMAWRRPGNKPLSDAMLVSLLTHASLGLNELITAWFNCKWIHNLRTDNTWVTSLYRCKITGSSYLYRYHHVALIKW